ncbi:MAG: hypothetical protein GWP61_04935 [Chloroflexi bacterium]|jgi:hypothetical protein|nr:hypothetical protein [Chloroflexota bacterium]
MSELAYFSIGWDVGGWNCDKNQRSRDAIVILNPDLEIMGVPWRGNLRRLINDAHTSEEWISGLFVLCKADWTPDGSKVVLAIDTPLAFSQAFTNLAAHGKQVSQPLAGSHTNPYLYRRTEQMLFAHGLRPLSAVKDMIGSQATKGMHVLAKFAPYTASCGVWTDGVRLTIFEAYPSACKASAAVTALRADYPALGNQDKEDALICALIAALFAGQRDTLWGPSEDTPLSEGWIWVPRDVTNHGLRGMISRHSNVTKEKLQ